MNTIELLELPERLIQMRQSLGWTQQHLAIRLNISKQQVQQWEKSRYQNITYRRLVTISKVLETAQESNKSK